MEVEEKDATQLTTMTVTVCPRDNQIRRDRDRWAAALAQAKERGDEGRERGGREVVDGDMVGQKEGNHDGSRE